MGWQSMLPGNLREHLGSFVEGWVGPWNVQGYEGKDGRIRKVRSEWERPDGRRRLVEVRYLARSTKIVISLPIPTKQEPHHEG